MRRITALAVILTVLAAPARSQAPNPDAQMVASWNLLSANIGANLPVFQAQLGEFLKRHNEMEARLKWYEEDDKGLRAMLPEMPSVKFMPTQKGKTAK
mgnify:FL=1